MKTVFTTGSRKFWKSLKEKVMLFGWWLPPNRNTLWEKVLAHFDLASYFDVVVGSEMNGGRTKKGRCDREETLKRLELEKHRDQVIMVGDKEHDVLGARQAGISCVAVTYGYGTMEELVKAGPLQIVNSPEQLLDFFC